MGNINKFRPLNGSSRNGRNGPSFLVCALFIGLCIVTVSYYNLSNQYTKLYDGMADMVKQQKLLEAHLENKKNEQINEKLKEKKSQESLLETKKLLETKLKELKEINNANTKTREELTKKTQELNDAQTKIKELETLKSQLNEDIVKQKEQINELTNKLFPVRNQNDINLQDNNGSGLDPKRKIVDNQPANLSNENKDAETRSKEVKQNSKEEDKKPANSKITKQDPVVNLLNKDKNTS